MCCVMMNSSIFKNIVFVHLCCILLLMLQFGVCKEIVCISSERETLLKVKQYLTDSSNRLSSWNATVNSNCCEWVGVVCNNVTSHVAELHLHTTLEYYYEIPIEVYRRWSFGGEINPYLVDLKHLSYLDFSGNLFLGEGMSIPSFFGRITSLTHLNLSYTGFYGNIPPQIGNLSNLLYLDLGYVVNEIIPSQIANLSKLQYLDLSRNRFEGMQIPTFLFAMTSLIHLDLSYSGFYGNIPSQIANLSNLVYLDLASYDSYEGMVAENVDWVSSMSKLEHLDLGGANLSNSFHWLHTLQALPSLTELYLSSCTLPHNNQPLLVNFSSLHTLDISFTNNIFPRWIFGLKKLVSLQLSENGFQGPIPDGIQNLTLVENLDLSYNLFSSSIPDCLYSLHHLKFLNLMSNKLHGTISDVLGNLTSLVVLNLSHNQLGGKFPTSLANLCKLRKIYFSNLKLNQQVNEILEILAPCISHGLTTLTIESSQLSGNLTNQIGKFKNIIQLDLYDNSIGGALPTSFGKLSWLRSLCLSNNQFSGNPFERLGSLSKLSTLEINDNHFQGVVDKDDLANLKSLEKLDASGNNLILKVGPNWLPSFQLQFLDMRSWHLGPNFPSWIQSQNKLYHLDMSNTGISDSIPSWFWKAFPEGSYVSFSHNLIHGELGTTLKNPMSFNEVDLSANNLCGKLPYLSKDVYSLDLSNNSYSEAMDDFLCKNHSKPMQLEVLNLASNNLSGKIPDCWMIWPFLVDVNLQSNHFIGNLPPSIGSLLELQSLKIRNNSISGILPTSLKKNNKLILLDLGENNLSGSIPAWVGEKFLNMKILLLRSNNFSGHIPNEICDMSLLQVLDLAQNNLSGNIPSCFNNLSSMTQMNKSTNSLIYLAPNASVYNIVSVLLWLKGRGDEYRNFLGLVTSIDLSSNKLLGEIPREITDLNGLYFLNLSHNQLIGHIPQGIDNMGSLLSLDFSNNQLSGEIPPTISNLSSLGMLDLSYNHLKGKIPTGTQLQTFDVINFIGNNLCGPPLPICSSNGKIHNYDHGGKGSDRGQVNGFFLSMAIGFILGLWIVIAPLLIFRSWRYAYFRFLDHVWFKLQSFCC